MNYFFYNTDNTDPTLRGARGRFRILIRKRFAATSGPRRFGEQLGKLAKGDTLLMYENEVGVVAVGTVLKEWDHKKRRPPLYYRGRFEHEYRIKVDWFLDLSDEPITLDELRRHVGSPHYTPRGAISPRIVKRRPAIERMIDQRRKAAELPLAPSMRHINRFFTDVLGANLRNPRWSWGAVDPITNRVFLRVWQDDIELLEDGERVGVASDEPRRDSNGFAERHAHLALMRNGAEGFGIICTAVDPNTDEVRRIAHFNTTTLLRLGKLTRESGRTFAHIDARVPVAEVNRQRTAQSTLTEDLKSLLAQQKIDSTTKEALVNARVGQGLFRSQVLQLWGNRCAVTRSTTLDAIIASHIKPWRESTDAERMDATNGLPLIASLDALFDAGLISFESSGRLIVSSMLTDVEQRIFGVPEASLTQKPSAMTADYLAYHRAHVFREYEPGQSAQAARKGNGTALVFSVRNTRTIRDAPFLALRRRNITCRASCGLRRSECTRTRSTGPLRTP